MTPAPSTRKVTPAHWALAAAVAFSGTTATKATADFPVEGLPVCTTHCGDAPLIATDQAGGAIVVWRDDTSANLDIYAQRALSSGQIAWPGGDVAVSLGPASKTATQVASDGVGGVVVVWRDSRNAQMGTLADIYVQRILANGSIAPGWDVNGVAATRDSGNQSAPAIIDDGAGGAFVSWDDRTSEDVYLQHISATGVIVDGWPHGGLAVSVEPGFQGVPKLVRDGSAGTIIAWGDLRSGQSQVYAQRISSDGQLHWAVSGELIAEVRFIRALAPDGAGGGYLACATAGPSIDAHYFVQRFDSTGTVYPGWPIGGHPVCTASSERQALHMVADGVGGVLFTWADNRHTESEIYAHRILPDGSPAPGWPVDGLRITTSNTFDNEPDIAPDGFGGAYVCWRNSTGSGQRVGVQHITANGAIAPGWLPGGLIQPGTEAQASPRIVADGAGGALVSWWTSTDVRVQKFVPDGPVPVAISLASAEAELDRVELLWQGPGLGLIEAEVDRFESGIWASLGHAEAIGMDRLRFADFGVSPGARYGYRLRYVDEGGITRHSETAWVSIPDALELSLEGFLPNPVVGAATIAFTLPRSEPARLEVMDVAGRRVARQNVGSLGPGRHVVQLPASLRPGVYVIRLHAGDQIQLQRGVVAR